MNQPSNHSPVASATVYLRYGATRRVPLQPASRGGQPEQQFMRWFRQQAAAEPGFPLRVRSILLLTDEPLCAGCHGALLSFFRRYRLASRLRVRAIHSAAAGCGCQHSREAKGQEQTLLEELLNAETAAELMQTLPLNSEATPLPQEFGELVQEYEGLFERFRRWVGKNPVKVALLKGAMDYTNPLPSKMAALADVTQSATEQRVDDAHDRQRIQAQTRNRPAAGAAPPPDRSRFAQPATNWADPRQAMGQPRPLPRVKVTPGR